MKLQAYSKGKGNKKAVVLLAENPAGQKKKQPKTQQQKNSRQSYQSKRSSVEHNSNNQYAEKGKSKRAGSNQNRSVPRAQNPEARPQESF